MRPFTTTCQQSILSVGRSDITLKIEVVVNIVAIGILFWAVFGMESVLWVAYGTLIAEIVSLGMFMYFENKIIGYTYKEQLQDLLPGIVLSVCMGMLVYLIRFALVKDSVALIIQIVVGAVFYLTVSYLLQLDSFVYLVKMLEEKIHSNKIRKKLERLVREK